MMSNGPPPSTSSEGISARLETARGSVRDTLGAIRNVEQLLKSIRVGPKALTAVIPDVHASCAPLLTSFRELLTALDDLGEAPRRIDAFIAPRIAELEQALRQSLEGPLNAKQRLSLESAVSRGTAELDAARGLVELLESTRGGAVSIQLIDVVHDATTTPDGSEPTSGKPVAITLQAQASQEALVNPKVAGRLLRIAVALVAERSPRVAPQVVICRSDSGDSEMRIRSVSGEGESLQLQTPRLIDCTLVCAEASARASGGALKIDTEQNEVTLTWRSAG